MKDVVCYASVALSGLSFLLFSAQVIASVVRSLRQGRSGGGMQDVTPHTVDTSKMMEHVGELAHAFAKAGPISTSAALSVMFMLIAVLESGLVKIE